MSESAPNVQAPESEPVRPAAAITLVMNAFGGGVQIQPIDPSKGPVQRMATYTDMQAMWAALGMYLQAQATTNAIIAAERQSQLAIAVPRLG